MFSHVVYIFIRGRPRGSFFEQKIEVQMHRKREGRPVSYKLRRIGKKVLANIGTHMGGHWHIWASLRSL